MANYSAALYTTLVILVIVFTISTIIIFTLYHDNKQALDKTKFLELMSLAAPNLIYVYDLFDGQFKYSNKSFFKLLGREDEEVTGVNIADFYVKYIHPDDRHKIKSFAENINKLKGDEVLDFELRLKHKNNDYLTLSNRIVVFTRTIDGEVQQILGTISDITKSKENERKLGELLFEEQKLTEELLGQKEELRSTLEETLLLNKMLIESEQRIDEAQRMTMLGSWQYDLSSGRLTWSEQLFRNYGLEPGEVTPSMEYFKKIIHPEDLAELEKRAVTSSDDLSPFDYRIVRKDGSVRYITSTVQPKVNEKGEIYKLIGAAQDVTERKRSEEQIKEILERSQQINEELVKSEESLLSTLKETLNLNEQLALKEKWLAETQRVAQLGIWEYNPEDKSILWTDEVFRLFGLENEITPTLEEFVSRIHTDDREKLSIAAQRAINEGISYEMEIRIILPDGKSSWIYTVGHASFDKDGKLAKLVGIVQDVDKRKRAEILLIESEQFFKALIQNSSDYVQTINSEAEIIYQSPTMARLTGYTPEERQGKSILDIIHPDDISYIESLKEEILREPSKPRTIELRIIHKNGAAVWLEVTVTNLLHQPGVNAFVINSRDITQRKEAEERLKNQNEELKKINSELDGFVYRASHDLRAPLSSILGLISISKEEKDIRQKEEYLNMMEKSVKKLDLFIRNIIDYSRNARLQISVTPVRFDELISSIFDEYKYMERSTLIERKLTIEGNTDFYSDIFRLKIIFSNIISNAIRYSNPRVNSFIRISINMTDANAVIHFEDNGAGIATESVNRIFEMFYRASESNVGSGLGLYIVKEVVQALGGTIKVDSELGKGTTFIVTVPNMITHIASPSDSSAEEIFPGNELA